MKEYIQSYLRDSSLYAYILSGAILFTGCSGGGVDADRHDEEKEHHDHIEMSHEAEENAGILTEKVSAGEFRDVVKAAGVIENTATSERVISAPASGIVSMLHGLVTGQSVGAGSTLFSISSRGTEQGEAVEVAKATLASAQRQLERGERLLADKLITQQEYDRLRGDVETAKAALAGVSARSAEGAVTVGSPIEGYVVSVEVSPGAFVNLGDRLAVVSRSRRLLLRADLSERRRHKLSEISGANITVPGSGREYSLEELECRVMTSGVPDVQGGGHYIPVYIEFDNPGGLYSGTPVETYLLGTPRHGVISVPREAIVEEGGVYSVFIREKHGVYERRRVTPGADDGRRVEITEGLKEGEEVVVNGALSVRMAGMGSQIQGHSHHH